MVVLALPVSMFAQLIQNPGMENWRSGTAGSSPSIDVQAPDNWFGFDSLAIANGQTFIPLLYPFYTPTVFHAQLFPDTVVFKSGITSAKLMTLKQDTLGFIPGTLSNAKVGINIFALIGGGSLASATTFSGGTGVAMRVTSVSAYVIYKAGIDSITGMMGGADTGLLTVQALAHIGTKDSVIGTGRVQILPTDTFRMITANIIYPTDTIHAVDTLRIVFSSSAGGTSRACDSSTLYIDDVTMAGVPNPDYSAVKEVAAPGMVTVYPNPSTGIINLSNKDRRQLNFRLFDESGRMVGSKLIKGNDNIDASFLPDGCYIYTVDDTSGKTLQRGKLTIRK